ncbi:hypothetical protein SAMN05518861_112194 [Mesorhizobium sp. YR577]|nr:hypothetical protein SAMN05518861_112194 [Mesorhizobium sp. YR577]
MVRRFFAVWFGFLAACLVAAGIVQGLQQTNLLAAAQDVPDIARENRLAAIPFLALMIARYAFLPGLASALVSEFYGWHRWHYYAAAGLLIGLAAACAYVLTHYLGSGSESLEPLMPAILLLAGLGGGAAYWVVAGRKAGLPAVKVEP